MQEYLQSKPAGFPPAHAGRCSAPKPAAAQKTLALRMGAKDMPESRPN